MYVMALLMFVACREESVFDRQATIDEELEEASGIMESENLMDEDVAMAEEALYEVDAETSGRSLESTCRTVTVDSTAYTVTIDFGEGCVGPYGRERSGQIVITYGGEFNDGLANRVVTFVDYYVNNRQISGTIELSNFNENASGNITATRKLIDYTVAFPNGTTRVINGSNTREILSGYGDGLLSNNIVSVTGSYTAATSRGVSYTYEIVEPVVLDYECLISGGMLRKSGVVEITRVGAVRIRTKTIDYGDSCDNTYSVSIDSEVVEVEG